MPVFRPPSLLPVSRFHTPCLLACFGLWTGWSFAAEPTATPLTEAGPIAPQLFSPLSTKQSGISFVNPIDTKHPLKRIYLGAFACGGVALGDLNGDGRPDIFLTSGPQENRLYLQSETSLKFTDHTAGSGIAPKGLWSAGATLVDVEGDGDLDIYVCNYDAPNQLWLNDGTGKFTEVAESYGLAIADASLMASFCDYDRDGDLDCFLLTRDFKRANGRPKDHPVEQIEGKWRIKKGFEKYYDIVRRPNGRLVYVNAGREDYLFRNDGPDAKGNLRFTDVSKAAGISGRDRGNSATWWDFNEDGLPDLYIGNDFKDADRLYRNNGNGTFTDVIRQVAPHTPWFSMGADIADLNGDGRTDLLIADMAGTNHYRSKTTMGEIGSIRPFLVSAVPRQYMHNVLYLNTGVGKIADASYLAGLDSSDWTWAVKLADFDLDGHIDVFFTNGVSRSFNNSDDQRTTADYIGKSEWDYYESHPPRKEQNLAFANHGGLQFEDVSTKWGLDHLGMSYAAATGDLDGDGDAELVVANLDEPVQIYRNNSRGASQRAAIRLRGAQGNRSGLGATVRLIIGEKTQVRTLRPTTGFLSSNVPELLFGLGSAETIDHLEVRWQSGHMQSFTNLKAGQRYTFTEPAAKPPAWTPTARPRPLFATITSPSLQKIAHREAPYDDYARQPLLPYKHSQLGPGLAWGDFDADGDEDFFLGGSTGSPGQLYRNEGNGQFALLPSAALAAHTKAEDLGALFFDADRNGTLDLYVVSGGVECDPDDASLRDRLYLNDGKGAFSAAPAGTLPHLTDSGSAVVAADYDRDGDLDLFVAGRVVPGAYPVTPKSRLLRNDSIPTKPRFVDITADTPGLLKAGLLSSALWSDANGDGWVDLLLASEWGPIKLFLNNKGTLKEATEEAGLSDHLGWWKGLASRDLDGDGDLDYVATNQGLNTPYQASAENPELMFYGDFEGTGKARIVEAKFEGKHCYPRRGFSCSSLAMPNLRKRLKSFHNFATSTLGDLYGSDLDTSLRLEANYLASAVLLNDGEGQFQIRPLPQAAQMAPSQGVLLTDINADAIPDCVLAQNFFGAQPEIGLLDGGLSVILLGRGDGTFAAMEPRLSGITVAGAATAVTTADLNGDHRPELVFAVNSSRLQIYSEPGARQAKNRFLGVALKGSTGNPTAIGARIKVQIDQGTWIQAAEVQAGSGYLGQSTPTCWFGLSRTEPKVPITVTVRWPDGTKSTTNSTAGVGHLVVSKPQTP